MELIREINALLEEKEQRLKNGQSTISITSNGEEVR